MQNSFQAWALVLGCQAREAQNGSSRMVDDIWGSTQDHLFVFFSPSLFNTHYFRKPTTRKIKSS